MKGYRFLDHIVHNDCVSNLEFGVIKTNTTDHCTTNVHLDITRSLNYLRHCLDLSNLEQDVDRLTESLADALKTTVNVFTFKEKTMLGKSHETWFDKDV